MVWHRPGSISSSVSHYLHLPYFLRLHEAAQGLALPRVDEKNTADEGGNVLMNTG